MLNRSVRFGTIDTVLINIITFISFLTRYHLIWYPQRAVFDEAHFGNFTNYYVRQEYFFDIHPPASKLLLASFSYLSGYKGDLVFSHTKYTHCDYVPLRCIVAFFSSLCPPLAFLTMRLLSFSRSASILPSILIMLDTTLGVEGRFILTDGILHFFTMLHVTILSYSLSLHHSTKLNTLLCGVSLGLACSSKNTAWGLMPFDALFVIAVSAFRFWPRRKLAAVNMVIDYGIALVGFLLVIYVGSFFVHMAQLDHRGYMEDRLHPALRRTVLGDAEQYGGYKQGNPIVVVRALSTAIQMFLTNTHVFAFHVSESRPENWPLLTGHYVGFFMEGNRRIACSGSPPVSFTALLGVILAFAAPLRRKDGRAWKSLAAFSFAAGWAFCYFPFFLIPRVMYLYHYCIPLMFGCLCAGAALDLFLPPRARGAVAVLLAFAALVGLRLWGPWVYGTVEPDLGVILWNKNWLSGDARYRERMAEQNNATVVDLDKLFI